MNLIKENMELQQQLEESRRECDRLKIENEEMRLGRYERGPVWDALQESRRECEKMKSYCADTLQVKKALANTVQSSLAREAAMRVALEHIANGPSPYQLKGFRQIAEQALSPSSGNPILDAMRAAIEKLKRASDDNRCGCKPICQCYSPESLRIRIEVITEAASEALAQLSTALGNEVGK